MNLNDQQIMAQVLSGRTELFDELVRRHRASMLRAACSKLRNSAAAEEAVQDAFLNAYARRVTFNPQYSFRGWLWTILLNTCRTLARRERNRPDQANGGDLLNLNEPVSNDDALGHLLHLERNALLAELLNELPEPQADALRLRFYGGLKFEEIAQVMNCSLNGAKRRVRCGLERLAASVRRNSSFSQDPERDK
jgi:RNA polymerase sigma-70 factor (ECF subfamily)